jgi:hypothetical protein
MLHKNNYSRLPCKPKYSMDPIKYSLTFFVMDKHKNCHSTFAQPAFSRAYRSVRSGTNYANDLVAPEAMR